MRVALVCQPWTRFHPPVDRADSIAIWSDQVGRRLGGEVTVLCRADPGQPLREARPPLSYHRLPYFPKWRGFTRMARALAALGMNGPTIHEPHYAALYAGWAAAACAERRADIIHVHNFAQFLPTLRRANPHARLVLHMHCDWLAQLDPAALVPWLREADAIWGCSDHVTAAARARFPTLADRFATVANGVDDGRFSLGRARPLAGHEILFVGRLSPEKGVHVLIAAFAQLATRLPAARLHLVGPNAATPRGFLVDLSRDERVRALRRFEPEAYGESLAALVPASCRDRVSFAGEWPPRRLPAAFARATVLVNPSLSESFGMSLVEAMSAGVPVIATATGGMPEIITHEDNGLLVPPDEPAALANSIERVLKDPALRARLTGAARQTVRARYTWPRIADDVRQRYRDLLDTGRATA